MSDSDEEGVKLVKRRRRIKQPRPDSSDEEDVTEKVYESESCTDSGEEFTKSKPAASNPSTSTAKPKTKAETKTSKKAPAASKGTKQASIMGFFQKK
ncbi:hypothetical protein AB205_0047570 [Aquarana catesbeiana]|uniref:DNA polymerase delta subunit 3 n=1 Tax=Aquarana catesbeiana TaxID=8400 RepID=A0A2G9QL80_AQUCT|nr:hypothetical protein AB205_0047570 [Aquarana catesbeiana]